ncbi:MAG: restriction endonuclease [Actinomycetota bacterium]|nr:restriction endonuclease [Actinomycetota bacterium]
MAVPDFQSLMRPLLVALADGGDHAIAAIRGDLAEQFALNQDDIDEMIPSGRVTTFQNRVGWAATYLYRTKLIGRPKRAVYRITDRGRQTLEQNPDRIDLKVLAQFQELEEFRQAKTPVGGGGETPGPTGDEEQTPEERIDSAYRELRSALAAELLDRVFDQTPEFFEQLVLDVLHKMGYGGRRDDAAERLGQSGDEGVDGVIREDRLGLDLIYVQAKRWKNVVGRPEIQKFFGALHGQRATKGVFITTSGFSREAVEYADGVSPRVILVDGKELAQLMIEHAVGVSVSREYELKRLDLDYFVTEDDEAPAEPTSPSLQEAP